MRTLIAIAVLCSSIHAGEIQDAMRRHSQLAQPPASPEKSVVTIYSPKSWRCSVCEGWKEFDSSGEDFTLEFKQKDQSSWTAYPVFNIGNEWYYGMTIEQVRRKVREQQVPQQTQQGKLCQCVSVTGNRQAYCPCLPLGKGCHCSPGKPHKFD